ncbi:DUF4245 domain-containing protein [Micromonospora sp. SL1-18]|uniref:DUF4245 domain-containing protein n=1 Tax=Micromonospora sp. SL1-18 TaxID=3399128 RepID=UPI003A4D52D9
MEAAQPADRVPIDATPPDGQPPVRPTVGPALAAGEPALVERATGPAPLGRGDRTRSERSPKDMALSLLVLLVPIALLLAFYRGFLGGEAPITVDPASAIELARSEGAFPVSQPEGLASDWRTVSARYRAEAGGGTLRIGYLTPEGRGAQLVESNVPADKLLAAELSGGQPQGPADLPGGSWQRYTARSNEQALVLLEPTRTVIVIGDARENELRQLAIALR